MAPPSNSRKSQLGRGVRLLGFWALGRHAVPSICTGKTIGRMSGVKTSHSMTGDVGPTEQGPTRQLILPHTHPPPVSGHTTKELEIAPVPL
eukprot:scaffold15313_cov132-Isochrysis_galbana.AAC.3